MNELRIGDRWRPPIIPHQHNYTGSITQYPTCEDAGATTYTCECGDQYTLEDIDPLGHDWEDWYEDPSCTVDGSKSRYCMTCGHITDGVPIDATGHDWGDWYETESPDCTNPGLIMRDCINCSFSESKNLDPSGHTWEDGFTVDQEPDCTTDGSQSRHCQECQDAVIDDTVIPALGHEWDNGGYVDPTEDEDGYMSYYCDNCGEEKRVIDEGSKLKPLVTLTLMDDTIVEIGRSDNYQALENYIISYPKVYKYSSDSEITVKGITFRRDQIKKIKFGTDEDLISYGIDHFNGFGANLINLIEIDRIPNIIFNPYYGSGLCNFLSGCTSFNQPITIPEGIKGENCLKGFLQDCTSFNQPIVIPESITTASGDNCLEGFLSGCTSFNQPITIPKVIDTYEGWTPLAGLLHNCDNMTSLVTLKTIPYYDYTSSSNSVNPSTFATSNPLAPSYIQGIPIKAVGFNSDLIREHLWNDNTGPHYRNLIIV